jgi:hypothetical protein
VGLKFVQSFIVHVNTATCFGYTNVAFIGLDIRTGIESFKNDFYRSFYFITFLKPSYSSCYIQPDDVYMRIAETCSWFYMYDKVVYRL